MSITIYKDKNFKGPKQVISSNVRDLKGMPADKPGSIKLSHCADKVLLYKNDDWHGGALFIRGEKSVSDLGSAKEGGRSMFGNCIRSIRVTPFKIRLNITVVKDGEKFPGIWPSDYWADGAVRDVIRHSNNYYLARQALLELVIARISYRYSPKDFNMSEGEAWSFPGAWKEPGEVDVIFVNRFEKQQKGGQAAFPCLGETVVLSVLNPDDLNQAMTNEDMAAVLAHELGHHLGLSHGTADSDPNNLMIPKLFVPSNLMDRELRSDQVREMQDRLANNISRRGVRIE